MVDDVDVEVVEVEVEVVEVVVVVVGAIVVVVVGADVVVVVVTASGFWIHEVGTMFPPNPLATVFAISSSPIS